MIVYQEKKELVGRCQECKGVEHRNYNVVLVIETRDRKSALRLCRRHTKILKKDLNGTPI